MRYVVQIYIRWYTPYNVVVPSIYEVVQYLHDVQHFSLLGILGGTVHIRW